MCTCSFYEQLVVFLQRVQGHRKSLCPYLTAGFRVSALTLGQSRSRSADSVLGTRIRLSFLATAACYCRLLETVC